ncbi:MAG: KamA family radical SAM protein [Desulfobacterales bacterium]
MTLLRKSGGFEPAGPDADITSPDALKTWFDVDVGRIKKAADCYPMKISPHFFSLIEGPGDAVWRQVVPDSRELDGNIAWDDPLSEENQSPVPGVIHRYPDRVLFLVSNQCAVYCRYCMRKRLAGKSFLPSKDVIQDGIAYIRRTPAIREVLLSGGDPLMLGGNVLKDILSSLREIPFVEVLRVHTRVPGALPHRISRGLADMLSRFHPLYINVQFNHPSELTLESEAACKKLADAGIPLGSQTVLLKGINDDPNVLKDLFAGLLKIRVKPYYLHHPDVVKGTDHFRVPVAKGLRIVKSLQGRISGMAIPRYMIDLPGGGGKIPLVPEFIRESRNGMIYVEGFDGKVYAYPEC